MKRIYVPKKFSASSMATIAQAEAIMQEYQAKGFSLSLRQLYYQLVARGLIENTVRSYKRIGNLVSDGRLAGLLDWSMIEDRNRETNTPPHWESPAAIVEVAAQQFAIDKWEDQSVHIEVMVEKDALSGVLLPVCRELDVRFTANKGYSSSSMMFEIGRRLGYYYYTKKKAVHVLYMGDHDPSGIDMTRDIEERLSMFSEGAPVTVHRLALNYDQVEVWQPPENPAKETDSRFESYVGQFGYSSWELDAVEPEIMADLVRQLVYGLRDPDAWVEAVERESEMRTELLQFVEAYNHKDE